VAKAISKFLQAVLIPVQTHTCATDPI